MKIYLTDLRTYGFCVLGAIEFCKCHNLNWHDFVKNGIEAELLITIGDQIGLDMVERKTKGLNDECR